jgi:hypothetical protein
MSELTKAFIKAQSEFPRIGKDGKADTGKYSYTYATLPSVMDAVLPALHKNGLALMQTFDAGEIVTTLRHASGESVDSRIGYPTSGVNPQDLGKWITYLRRYAIVAMLGLAPDDDDDAAGVGAPPPPKPPAKKATPPVPTTTSDEDEKFLRALEDMKARMIVALEIIGGFADTAAEMQLRFNRLLGSSGYEKPLEITGKPARLKFYRQLEETVEAVEAQAHEVAEAGI